MASQKFFFDETNKLNIVFFYFIQLYLIKTRKINCCAAGAECGVSTGAHNLARILGGVEARPHSWPWQAFIRCIRKDNIGTWRAFGGASIISDKWVITGAHVLNEAIYDIRHGCQVYLGKHNIQSVESTQVRSKIAKYVFHPNYKYGTFDYDLALIKLDTTLSFTDAIKPICLPLGLHELPVNKTCYATGWGNTVPEPITGTTVTRKMSDVLKQLPMTVQMERDCYTANYTETGRIICNGWRNMDEDTCRGDSGGPLACQESDKKCYLRGVISHGSHECHGMTSSTKVSVFAHWINKLIDRKRSSVASHNYRSLKQH